LGYSNSSYYYSTHSCHLLEIKMGREGRRERGKERKRERERERETEI
jgi:hypothetical protein